MWAVFPGVGNLLFAIWTRHCVSLLSLICFFLWSYYNAKLLRDYYSYAKEGKQKGKQLVNNQEESCEVSSSLGIEPKKPDLRG